MNNASQDFKNFMLKEGETQDTTTFSFSTGGGIDTLMFQLIHHMSQEIMTITVTNLTYDIPYYINLMQFKPGNYAFDFGSFYKPKGTGGNTLNDFKQLRH